MADMWVSDRELGDRFGVHRTTPWNWARTLKGFPQPVKLGPACTRWRLSEIEAWEQAQARVA